MHFGLQLFPTDTSVPPAEFARLAERHGFESVFFPEESHIPVRQEDGSPTGGDLPPNYFRTIDPVIAMTAAASVTTRIKVGSAVATIAQRDTIQFAKEISSLDHLSGGRVLLGVGVGWNTQIMRNHGLDPETRWRVMREKVQAMTAIWSEDEAEYHGQYVNFDPILMWPKPVQRPRPPVLVGGGGPGVLDRVVEYGDGWMPFRMGPADTESEEFRSEDPEPFEEDLAVRMSELARRAAEAGRGPLRVTLFNAKPQAAALRRYREMGVERCIFHLPSESTQVVNPMIASLGVLIAELES